MKRDIPVHHHAELCPFARDGAEACTCSADHLVANIRRALPVRWQYRNEAEVHQQIAGGLRASNIPFEHEVEVLGGRIDFVAYGCIGTEVKIGGSYADVLRQVFKYADDARFIGFAVVTTRRVHVASVDDPKLKGKPVTFIHAQGWP
ncbi:MAG: hypothetical protein HOV80_17800 [Polyangiaceae bacterium]|nr:hypothetical protein [Polyangiaceae bacterium]